MFMGNKYLFIDYFHSNLFNLIMINIGVFLI